MPELDTLYHSSKEKLKSTEQGGKPNIDTSQLAELTEHAKKLPELGVRKNTCTYMYMYIYVHVHVPLSVAHVCIVCLSPHLPLLPLPISDTTGSGDVCALSDDTEEVQRADQADMGYSTPRAACPVVLSLDGVDAERKVQTPPRGLLTTG